MSTNFSTNHDTNLSFEEKRKKRIICLVHGYIRNTYNYNKIPKDVINLCLNHYWIKCEYFASHEIIKISKNRLSANSKDKYGTILFGSFDNRGYKEIHFKINELYYMGLCIITNKFTDWNNGDLKQNIFFVNQQGTIIIDKKQFTVLQGTKRGKANFRFHTNSAVRIILNMYDKYAEFKNKRKRGRNNTLKIKIPDTKCAIAIFLNHARVTVTKQIIA